MVRKRSVDQPVKNFGLLIFLYTHPDVAAEHALILMPDFGVHQNTTPYGLILLTFSLVDL